MCRVVHLDLKSCNVLIAGDGTAKISDVGLALLIRDRYLSSTAPAGTFAWVAPEIILGGSIPQSSAPSCGPPVHTSAHSHSLPMAPLPRTVGRPVSPRRPLIYTGVLCPCLSGMRHAMLPVRPLTELSIGWTELWQPPSLCAAGHVSEKADVFSFGVVLWEIVTLERPTWRGNMRSVR